MKRKPKILAFLLAIALILTFVPFMPAMAAGEFTAQVHSDINGQDADGENINGWPDLPTWSVDFDMGEETTITIDFDVPVSFGGNYFAVNTNVPFTGEESAEVKSFKIDGAEVAVGELVYTDEGIDKGFRINICNKWNGDIEVQPVGNLEEYTDFSKIEITFVVYAEGGPGIAEPPEKPAGPDFDPNGSYMAYLGVQMNNWIFRDPWDSALGDPDGVDGSAWADFDQSYFSGLFETAGGGKVHPGTFTDAELKGNGTYRVSLVDWDFSDPNENGPAESFNQLFVSTDIPYTEALEFTNVKVIVGGNQRYTFKEAVILDGDYIRIGGINIWDDELQDLFNNNVPASGEIAMEFTVTGFAYDNDDSPIIEEEPSPTPSYAPASPSPAATDDGDEEGGNGLMIALIIGGVVLLVVIIVVVMMKKKK
ncbi:MAG: hypothetical protein FWG31_09480 [Oscillospiraceae bacterium]|nr:hypothetical protein [Oscillospiraceae bacterium]